MEGVASTAGVTLQPVFIPRQHSGLGRGMSMQQPGSPTGTGNNNGMAAAAASADWAYLLRNAAALRGGSGSLSSSDAAALLAAVSQDQGVRATSPQVMTSPGRFLLATSAGMTQQGSMGTPQQQQRQQAAGNSVSGLFGSNSMVSLDALGHLSAEALASAACDPSNSLAMLSTGTLAPTLSNMSGMYADGGVQTLYGSNEAAAVASAAAAAAAAGSARATTTQSILQQQAAALGASNGSLANTLGAGFQGLSSSLNLNGLMQFEESLSGSLFGPGGGAVSPMPKPVSASLYIKNLPVDANKLFLYEKFSPYGAILSVKVLNDPQSGQCRGVGFVNFAEHTSATRSIQALHGTKVGDKLLHVSLQTPRLRAAAMNAMM